VAADAAMQMGLWCHLKMGKFEVKIKNILKNE
jgi:hypothetical protein